MFYIKYRNGEISYLGEQEFKSFYEKYEHSKLGEAIPVGYGQFKAKNTIDSFGISQDDAEKKCLDNNTRFPDEAFSLIRKYYHNGKDLFGDDDELEASTYFVEDSYRRRDFCVLMDRYEKFPKELRLKLNSVVSIKENWRELVDYCKANMFSKESLECNSGEQIKALKESLKLKYEKAN